MIFLNVSLLRDRQLPGEQQSGRRYTQTLSTNAVCLLPALRRSDLLREVETHGHALDPQAARLGGCGVAEAQAAVRGVTPWP
jgi:hypothetical protein